MSETTTQRMTLQTLEQFNKMKEKYLAKSASFDEFLNVLMVVYETQRDRMKTVRSFGTT